MQVTYDSPIYVYDSDLNIKDRKEVASIGPYR